MRTYNQMQNIGKSKYVVNYCDGVKKHLDGSLFYDIAIFSNKKKLKVFIDTLHLCNYTEE